MLLVSEAAEEDISDLKETMKKNWEGMGKEVLANLMLHVSSGSQVDGCSESKVAEH